MLKSTLTLTQAVLLSIVGHIGQHSCLPPTIPAQETYAGVRHSQGTVSRLRIGNGGAGQSGLVKALSQAYIYYSRDNGLADEDYLVISGKTLSETTSAPDIDSSESSHRRAASNWVF
jgi:hypothetical protein